jgi:hypothetical protein
MNTKSNPGHFQAGYDPRRHTFTREECRRGFQAAEESIERRFPGADSHFLMCAIIGSKAGYGWPKPADVAGMTDEELAAKFAIF